MGSKHDRYRTRTVHTSRRRAPATAAAREARGWEVVASREIGRRRFELTLRRPRRAAPRARNLLPAIIVLSLLVAATLTWGRDLVEAPPPAAGPAPELDSDSDGMPDSVEEAGWRATGGRLLQTDPARADTDGDGLTDGVEAGQVGVDPIWGATYALQSDPTEWDSDQDGLDDATELDGGFDAWAPDTDGDGLDDFAELEYGSDPRNGDPDGDGVDDAAEQVDGSAPHLYDLTAAEGTAAALGGALTFGNRRLAGLSGLSARQIDSWQFLVGSLARRFIPLTSIRETLGKVRERDLTGALLSAGGSIPIAGTAIKVSADAVKFAGQSEAAVKASLELTTRLRFLDDETLLAIARSILRINPSAARLTADVEAEELEATEPLLLTRPISSDSVLNAEKVELVDELELQGFTDIRVNERQVDADGQVVGENRPDLQATDSGGTRHYYEFETPADGQGPSKRIRLLANDPEAVVRLIELD